MARSSIAGFSNIANNQFEERSMVASIKPTTSMQPWVAAKCLHLIPHPMTLSGPPQSTLSDWSLPPRNPVHHFQILNYLTRTIGPLGCIRTTAPSAISLPTSRSMVTPPYLQRLGSNICRPKARAHARKLRRGGHLKRYDINPILPSFQPN